MIGVRLRIQEPLTIAPRPPIEGTTKILVDEPIAVVVLVVRDFLGTAGCAVLLTRFAIFSFLALAIAAFWTARAILGTGATGLPIVASAVGASRARAAIIRAGSASLVVVAHTVGTGSSRAVLGACAAILTIVASTVRAAGTAVGAANRVRPAQRRVALGHACPALSAALDAAPEAGCCHAAKIIAAIVVVQVSVVALNGGVGDAVEQALAVGT